MERSSSLKYLALCLGLLWLDTAAAERASGQNKQIAPENQGLCTQKIFHDEQTKRLFVPSSMPLKLLLQTGQKAGSEFALEKTAEQPESYLHFPEGEHLLTVSSTVKQIYRIVGDANPPETRTHSPEVPSTQKGGITYYGRGFEINLDPTDTASGLDALYLSLNGSSFKPTEQRKLSFTENGSFRLVYFACDRVGNREPFHRSDFMIDVTEPESVVTVKSSFDRRHLGPASLISIKAIDGGIGVGATYFKFDAQEFQNYDREISVVDLSAGQHTLSYYSEDALNNKEGIKTFQFNYDPVAPKLALQFIGKQWQDGELVYLNHATRARILSDDQESGIHANRMFIDDKSISLSENAYTLSVTEGPHTIKAESMDRAGNLSILERKVYVDAEAPHVNLELLNPAARRDGMASVIGPLRVKLHAEDRGSGVKEIQYCVNDEACQVYQDVIELDKEGVYKIRYFARDRLDQLSPSQTESFHIRKSFAQNDAQPRQEIKHWVGDDQSGAIGPAGKVFRLEIADGPTAHAQRFAIGIPIEALQIAPSDEQGLKRLMLKLAKFTAEIKVPVDEQAPLSSHVFQQAPSIESSGKRFFGKGLAVSLRAEDPNQKRASGVADIYFSINGAPFGQYTRPLQEFASENAYQLTYYAVDRVGNREPEKRVDFTLDLTPPHTKVSIEGKSYRQFLSRGARIRLSSDDLLSQTKATYFAFDQAPFQLYEPDTIDGSLARLKSGGHILRFYSVDHVMNKESERTYRFHVDDDAPRLSHEILGPSFQSGQTLFINRGARLVIRSIDKGAGVDQVSYRLNDKAQQSYTTPLELHEVRDDLSLEYSAVDRVDNSSKSQRFTLKLDTVAPTSKLTFEGSHYLFENRINLKSHSKIIVSSEDSGSGLGQIHYRINSGDFMIYKKPLQFPPKSENLITIYAADRVGNREIPLTYRVIVDDEKPSLEVKTSDGLLLSSDRIYPKDTLFYISAYDAQAGVKEIYYRLGRGPLKLYRQPFTVNDPGENKLEVVVKDWMGSEDMQTLTYRVEP